MFIINGFVQLMQSQSLILKKEASLNLEIQS